MIFFQSIPLIILFNKLIWTEAKYQSFTDVPSNFEDFFNRYYKLAILPWSNLSEFRLNAPQIIKAKELQFAPLLNINGQRSQ